MHSILVGKGMLFLSLFSLLLGLGLQASLIGIRGMDEGFSTFVLSMISTGYYAGFFLGSIVVPIWLKRVGYIRMFAALVAVSSVSALTFAMFIDEYVWFFMRLVTGMCLAGTFLICESWLNSQTNNDNRAKVLSLYVVILYLGLSGGQFLLNLGDTSGYALFALGSIVISIASVPLLLTTRPVPVIEETTSNLTVMQLYRRSPLGVVASFFANYMNGSIAGLSAIYAKSIGMPTSQIALFIASAYIGVIVFQMPIGSFSDRIDRRKVIIAACLFTIVISVLAMGTNTDDNTRLTWLFFLLGGTAFPLYALSIAYVNDRLNPEEVLPATAALLKIGGVGNMISPMITGWIMVKFGMEWFFGMVGVAAACVALFGMYRTSQAEIDVEDQSDFAPMGVVTATSATLSLAHEGIQLEFDFGHTDTEEEANDRA